MLVAYLFAPPRLFAAAAVATALLAVPMCLWAVTFGWRAYADRRESWALDVSLVATRPAVALGLALPPAHPALTVLLAAALWPLAPLALVAVGLWRWSADYRAWRAVRARAFGILAERRLAEQEAAADRAMAGAGR